MTPLRRSIRQSEAPDGEREEPRGPREGDGERGQHVGDVEPAHHDAAQPVEDPGRRQQVADGLERGPVISRGNQAPESAATAIETSTVVAMSACSLLRTEASNRPSVLATSESETIITSSAAGSRR